MAEAEIHLTEYFAGETVVISAGGHEAVRVERVKTDLRKGLARIVRLSLPDVPTTLTIEVPERHAQAGVTLDPGDLKHVSVALGEGGLQVKAISKEEYRREPRGYA